MFMLFMIKINKRWKLFIADRLQLIIFNQNSRSIVFNFAELTRCQLHSTVNCIQFSKANSRSIAFNFTEQTRGQLHSISQSKLAVNSIQFRRANSQSIAFNFAEQSRSQFHLISQNKLAVN